MWATVEVNFTDTALFQTKVHWAVTETVRKKWCKMPLDGSILTWVNTIMWCVLHMYLHVCLYLSQKTSTTNLVFKWLNIFEMLLVLEEVIYDRRTRQAESSRLHIREGCAISIGGWEVLGLVGNAWISHHHPGSDQVWLLAYLDTEIPRVWGQIWPYKPALQGLAARPMI